MGQYIKDNGKEPFVKVMEFKFGLMVLDMKAIGRMIWLMARESSLISMEMSMRVTGSMIKHGVTEFILITKMDNMKVIGRMMFNMDTANRHGQMDQLMRVNM